MRILILGNNNAALEFFKLFETDKENIVFSPIRNEQNYIDFSSDEDIVDFSSANDINMVLITDEKYINSGLAEKISSLNISVFAPSSEAVEIAASKAFSKRFMYKNKISTPKFSIVEKVQAAYEYVKQTPYPLAIKPDKHSFCECPIFVETNKQAHLAIDKLLTSDNHKIIIEDFVFGKNVSIWAISDGYSAKIIGANAKYQNIISIFEPDFLTDEIKEKIYNDIVAKTISALSSQGAEYIGILGFDIIIDKDNEPHLIGYNSFFDDISVPFFTQGFDYNWLDVFESCLVGDIFAKYQFESPETFMATLRQGEVVEFVCANTKSNLKTYLLELGFDLDEFFEAQKLWSY